MTAAGLHEPWVDMTVYDKVGASASVTYPTLRITFKLPMESTPL